MHFLRRGGHGVRILVGALLLASTVAGISPALPAAVGATAQRPGAAAGFVTTGGLTGVAATSARDVWAVGHTSLQLLIVHWNGTAWRRVRSPQPRLGGNLTATAAVSARNAWAVGYAFTHPHIDALIEHWNGTAWRRVSSPALAGDGILRDVAATSASDAWAVGHTVDSATGPDRPLIERWNGTAWRRVPSPAPASGGSLSGVAATSPRNAWAVGSTASNTPLIVHWNGAAWRRVPSPRPGGHRLLTDVAATSASNAWAVGFISTIGNLTGPGKTLIERWNGTAWRRVPSPTPADGGFLLGVAVGGNGSAWAVGFTGTLNSPKQVLIEHWNGTIWRRVPSTAAAGAALGDVAVISERGAWAVGSTSGDNGNTVIMHWNGNTWKAGG